LLRVERGQIQHNLEFNLRPNERKRAGEFLEFFVGEQM
jgi:hypothetical protein